MAHSAYTLNLTSGQIDLSHGGGGRAMAQLIDALFIKHFDNDLLKRRNDQAVFQVPAGRLAISTDGHVISPLFFPGGDIGALAVHGTLNDVAMSGARPLYLAAGFILEEGLALADLDRIVASMAAAAKAAGTPVVTGDTKVVERGKGDGVFITTTGVGIVPDGVDIAGDRAEPGCAVLVSGSIGDHGVAIMAGRENLQFGTSIVSDSAALHGLVADMVAAAPTRIRCLRDPTRGGLATALNELAEQSGVGIVVDENRIPIKAQVRAACEILGLDPLYVANEGKLVCICEADAAETLLNTMQNHPLGRDASIIGTVVADQHHFVQMTTGFGGRRIVDWPAGEQLPRIC
ncbi:hydrogenase expression/formation protein HypE [Methylomonas sp. MED-D]|uniref:hydrogenase expression/formation protein HypE n=1 Tax=unclassified Methylomonas TaxID=2608980 RepID=UPI00143BD763|nr:MULTISPECIES: hydrogenase expression/formation protein HypE [unclassified Methylomonas]MDT4331723.1 hydrogenase expression/formation protein HypE [Methylomonas sp. MV1]NJA05081.1 hydrogenase expression/formation protein HypE [Methylococcaceae bacterium WWC4]WGS84139.1 hydrogenase expression/formation protein HypE [Methylomonas sp. UP202]